MSTPTSTVNGVASGIQWQSMVDQIITLETQRTVTPLQTQQTALTSTASAWKDFQTIVGKFRDAAKTLRDGTAFTSFTATGGASATTGRALVTATPGTSASAGTYSVGVEQLATAEKLGSATFSSATTALNVTGTVLVNGRRVTIAASDTLTGIRDKINALNTGASKSGVTASLSKTSGGTRLILSADDTGVGGVELSDVSGTAVTTLGLSDGTTTANLASNGATQSYRASSSIQTFAALWGIPLPSPSTITVGGQTITVDFSTDTLASIAAQINAATGVADAAAVVSESVGSKTMYRLNIALPVQADGSDATASAAVLATLGLTKGGRSDVAQVLKSANTLTDGGNGGIAATASTLLTNVQIGGQNLGVQAGDVIALNGRRGDGTVVAITLAVTGTTTMQDLLTAANGAVSGFGAGTRTATAALSNGLLTLTDATAGSSQLSLAISATRNGARVATFGPIDTTDGTAGMARQLVAGNDARLVVDGQAFTRSSNTITDVIAGVTLNALAAEAGTTSDLVIARNTDDITKQLQTFASTYNAVRSWAAANTAEGKALAHNSSVRAMVQQLSSAFSTPLTGLSGQYNTGGFVGLSRDKYGVMSVDTTTLSDALTSSFEDVKELFGRTGLGGALYTAADAIAKDTTGSAAKLSKAATTQASAMDTRILAAQDRVEVRRTTLTNQFIAMETAMAKAQALGSSLTSSINSLFNYNKSSG